jgi:replicative DNA helicase
MDDLHTIVSQEQIDTERALIGAVVRTPELALQKAGWLTSETFMVPNHKEFWNRVLNGEDPVTVCFAVPDMNAAFSWSNDVLADRVGDYAQALFDKDNMRTAVIAAEEIVKASRKGDGDAIQAIAQSLSASQGSGNSGMRSAMDIALSLNERIDQKDLSIPWGIESIDTSTRGSERGTLTILAARPSMGKSSLATQVVEYQALDLELKVGAWALEMSAEQMFARRTCHLVDAMWMDVRSDNITARQREDLKRHVIEYAEKIDEKMLINDSTHTRLSDIVRTQLRYRYDVLMIDHGGLLNDTQMKGERHDQFIGRLTKTMHDLAKNTQSVVICLWQLNRGVESRQDKHPNLGDLRDSGHIEQNADNIGFMFGDWYYNPNSDHGNITELNWAKYRDGVKDSLCLVQFNKSNQTFESVETRKFDAYIEQQMEKAHEGTQGVLIQEPEDIPF